MKILITGVNGFLGKCISKQISVSNSIWGLSRNGSDFNFDLKDSVPVFDVEFDLVIHAAGKAHTVPKAEFEKQQFYDVNVLGTKNLLEGLTKSAIPKFFVFISSVSVYGKEFGSDITENVNLGALDPYGISKIEAEQIVLDWCKKNQVTYTILRLPLLVGSDPPGNLRHMIYAIRKGFYFNVSGGSARKSMVLTSDVAKIILRASSVGGIYNLTDGYNPSFRELSLCISKQLNKKFLPNIPKFLAYILAKVGDIIGPKFPFNSSKLLKINSTLTFNDSNARKAFNWNPTPVLEGFKINE